VSGPGAVETMDQGLTTSFGLLERRLALMRDLAGTLEQAQGAVVRLDLPGIDRITTRQQDLCEVLRQLESEGGRHARSIATSGGSPIKKAGVALPDDAVSPALGGRWKTLSEEVSRVEIRVFRLNQVYGALLRRARRTAQIYACALASSANTYPAPKREPAMATPMFEESHV
jgi:hypothetical protein